MGHHLPLTAASLHIKDSVENLTEVYGDGVAKAFGLWQQWFDDFPLGITQVAGVSFAMVARNRG